MPIDVRLLRPFLVTADHLSFTKAADELGVSQPRLSLLIKKLEGQLGFALFVRAPHHVHLSREGAQFLEHAQEIGGAIRHFDRSVSDMRSKVRTRIRIGSPISTTFRFPRRYDLIDQFVTRHPTVRLKFESAMSNTLLDRLRSGKLDLTMSMMPFDSSGLSFLFLEKSSTFLAIPRESALVRYNAITPELLKGTKIAVTPLSPTIPSYLTLSLNFLREAGATIVEAYEPQQSLLLHYAHRKRLCAITHKWRGDAPNPDDGYTDMVFRPLIGTDLSMKVYLLKLSGSQPSAVEWFWKLAKNFAEPAKDGDNASH